jgi:glutamate-1-semialdehyde aminotransferase
MSQVWRPRSPEESRLLETAARCLPGGVLHIVFTDQPITDYRAMLAADGALLKAFNVECPKRGVVKGREKLYVSLVHSDQDAASTLEAFEGALAALPRTRAGA